MTVRTPAKPKALDRTAQRALRELRALRAQKDELDQKIKDRERKIKEAMGTHEEASVGGVVVVTWKTAIRQRLDLNLVKKTDPELAANCMVQTEVRTFKILGDE